MVLAPSALWTVPHPAGAALRTVTSSTVQIAPPMRIFPYLVRHTRGSGVLSRTQNNGPSHKQRAKALIYVLVAGKDDPKFALSFGAIRGAHRRVKLAIICRNHGPAHSIITVILEKVED